MSGKRKKNRCDNDLDVYNVSKRRKISDDPIFPNELLAMIISFMTTKEAKGFVLAMKCGLALVLEFSHFSGSELYQIFKYHHSLNYFLLLFKNKTAKPNMDRFYALRHSCYFGYDNVLEYVLKNHKPTERSWNDVALSIAPHVLTDAIYNGHTSTVRILLGNGVSPLELEHPPILVAWNANRFEIMEILLDFPDFAFDNNYSETVIDDPYCRGFLRIVCRHEDAMLCEFMLGRTADQNLTLKRFHILNKMYQHSSFLSRPPPEIVKRCVAGYDDAPPTSVRRVFLMKIIQTHWNFNGFLDSLLRRIIYSKSSNLLEEIMQRGGQLSRDVFYRLTDAPFLKLIGHMDFTAGIKLLLHPKCVGCHWSLEESTIVYAVCSAMESLIMEYTVLQTLLDDSRVNDILVLSDDQILEHLKYALPEVMHSLLLDELNEHHLRKNKQLLTEGILHQIKLMDGCDSENEKLVKRLLVVLRAESMIVNNKYLD
jgi:hypothetical protein